MPNILVNGRNFDLEVDEVKAKTVLKLAGTGLAGTYVITFTGANQTPADDTLQKGYKAKIQDGTALTVTPA
jgi:hypothetical protein